MTHRVRRARIALIAMLVGAQSAAGQYYSVTGGGAQLDIGDAARPVQVATGTGTVFPPLLIPPNPDPAKALLQQTAGPDPKRMTIPPRVLYRKAPGVAAVGVALRNTRLFQVRTNATFSAPAAAQGSAVLRAGGRTGAATTTFPGVPLGSKVRYAKTAAQFGGPAQIGVVPMSPARVWGIFQSPPPCKHPKFLGVDTGCVAVVFPEQPGTLAAPGAAVGFTTMTPGPMTTPNFVAVSVPKATGLVAKSSPVGNVFVSNKATSVGFPWTTGMITISAPAALGGKELHHLTGMDARVKGTGTISLVSASLSKRSFSGPNANRGWLRLTVPEPGAAIGALAALATLAVCHWLVGRRSRGVSQ